MRFKIIADVVMVLLCAFGCAFFAWEGAWVVAVIFLLSAHLGLKALRGDIDSRHVHEVFERLQKGEASPEDEAFLRSFSARYYQ